jgi:pyridoxine/pyridoxamine 5'-phosphate oxidase
LGVALAGFVVNVQRDAVHERLVEAAGTLKGFELRNERRSEGGRQAMPDQWVDYVVVDFQVEYSEQNRMHIASRFAFGKKVNAYRVGDE